MFRTKKSKNLKDSHKNVYGFVFFLMIFHKVIHHDGFVIDVDIDVTRVKENCAVHTCT
jgi:hypothetical protein